MCVLMHNSSNKIQRNFILRLRGLFHPNGSFFYGWWIVAMAAFVMYLGSLFWMQSYGAYTVVLNREFGWSMTLLSGAYALTRIESGLLGPLQGWIVDRYGPRLIVSIGLLMFGLGLLWLTQVETLPVYYLVVFFISAGKPELSWLMKKAQHRSCLIPLRLPRKCSHSARKWSGMVTRQATAFADQY